jgi:hypothetical protein
MNLKKVLAAIDDFFLTPASAVPLAVLRIGCAATLIAQALMLRTSILDFFAHDGIIQGELATYLSTPYAPRISWFVQILSLFHVTEAACIYFCCSIYFVSLVLQFVGLFTRGASVVVWFLHWMFMNTGFTTNYGVDLYLHVFLFYLVFAPSGDALSLDVAWGRRSGEPSEKARLALRVIQLHLCITYFCSAVEKASGIQWWNGELLWRAFYLPVYKQFDMTWLVDWPILSKVAGWSTLVFEGGYFIFIWPKQTRTFWVFTAVGLHMGIAIFLGLVLFGVTMSILTVAAFGFSPEPDSVLLRRGNFRRLAVS